MRLKKSNDRLLDELKAKKENLDLSRFDNYGYDKSQKEMAELYEKILLEINDKDKEIIELDNDYRELLANLSHDLRTPLTSIIGYLSLIDEEDEDNNRYLNISLVKANQLKDLIEKFYEYSLIASGSYGSEYEKLRINEVLNASLINYYDVFNEAGKSTAVEILEEDEIVYSSRKLLSIVFNNLLDNMYKYSFGNNEVKIERADTLKIIFSNDTDLEDGNYLYLLDRMRVLDNSRKSTGLGLSIVKEALDKLKYDYEIIVKDNRYIFTIIIK